jgi:hypothetical protein
MGASAPRPFAARVRDGTEPTLSPTLPSPAGARTVIEAQIPAPLSARSAVRRPACVPARLTGGPGRLGAKELKLGQI